MAQTSVELRFVYGTKSKYTSASSSYADDIYFATDTKEIIARGVVFGVNDADAELLSKLSTAVTDVLYQNGTIQFSQANGSKKVVQLFGQTPGLPPESTGKAGSENYAARADHIHPLQTSVSGNAGTATQLATPHTLEGISFNGAQDVSHFGTCSTGSSIAAKTVTISGQFLLKTGSRVVVKFTYSDAPNSTLNVNGTGAKSIRYNGAATTGSIIRGGRTYEFVYDGTYWQLVGDIDTNTTYSGATQSAAGLMSAADKKKLDGITAGAKPVTVDSALSSTSTNPVQNKAIKAELDKKVPIGSDGKIASSYLPSYVDDVVEIFFHTGFGTWDAEQIEAQGLADGDLVFDSDDNNLYEVFTNQYGSLNSREVTPETGKIYVGISDNKTYRWSGSTLVEISKSLALGTTSSTAFPGDRGLALETNYNSLSTKVNKNTTNITNLTTRVSDVEKQLCWYES